MGELTVVLDAPAGAARLALLDGWEVLAERTLPARADLLPPLQALLGAAGASARDLRRVVCGEGPGGFTSLRLAAALGKGLATAARAEFWAVSSMGWLAATALAAGGARVVVAIDAHRGEWYACGFGRAAGDLVEVLEAPRIVDADGVAVLAGAVGGRVIAPDGTAPPGAERVIPSAAVLADLAAGGTLVRPVDLATWEPTYGRLSEAQVQWERRHARPLDRA